MSYTEAAACSVLVFGYVLGCGYDYADYCSVGWDYIGEVGLG